MFRPDLEDLNAYNIGSLTQSEMDLMYDIYPIDNSVYTKYIINKVQVDPKLRHM